MKKTTPNRFQPWMVCAMALSLNQAFTLPAAAADAAHPGLVKTSLPLSQISAKAGADYHGEGLVVVPTAEGARLRCVFQRLEAEATPEGLWMTSTFTNTARDHFRVVAAQVGSHAAASLHGSGDATRGNVSLPQTGTVAVAGQVVRFARPGVVEEYSVSLDGVQQDFILAARPAGRGELAVWLAVSGAKVEPAIQGAQLVLDGSGRKIAYSRLRATDATGKELPARIEVTDKSEIGLAVVVDDAEAVYPVRIDPTFSDANWISMSGITGADNSLSATAVDGSGNLYIGGSFTVVGGAIANGIAKWDGTNWSALGSGMNSWVGALAVWGNNVYAGGGFTMAGGKAANYIARWDGTNWSALGSGMSGSVYALAVSGNNVYAASGFTMAGGKAVNYIAKWDGSAWSVLGSGMEMECPTFPPPCPPPMVSALAVSGTNLYAGGRFTTAGGVSAANIAKWDGNAWSALGSGMNSDVSVLTGSGNNVYAGGGFTTAGGKAANYIAKWDGSAWSALGSGVDSLVYALAVSGTNVYAGGEFTTAGGTPASYIARWDGNSWSALGPGMDSYVYALAVSGSNLCAGGLFKMAGATSANYIAKWDGSNWSALGSGMNGNGVLALAGSSTNLYAVGSFTYGGGGGVARSYIAKWDGGSWNALGSGMNGAVSALVVSGTNLYAGGSFTTAGGVSATNIAKWDGSSWSALGSGTSGGVSALVMLGSGLYAGGNFTAAGGVSAINIAKWDGSSWSALGPGLGSGAGDQVFALAAWGGNLYAGGWFTNAGGVSATYIAKWDGSSWSAVGSGLNAGVGVLSGSSGDLYAASGISFLGGPAGGIPTNNYIARWNGSSWSAAPGLVSPNRLVNALALSGSDLYAGGWFTSAGGVSASYIAKWDGTNWSALGSGMNSGVSALLVSGGDLYAGGSFTIAGGKVSGFVARAHLFSIPALSIVRSGNAVNVSWPSVDAAGFALKQADNMASSVNWAPITGGITDVGTNKSVTVPATNSQQFFRLQGP